ncbi:MAG: C69 family dipeptidase [Actinobacteria bacterium]|nr:C69 family dipeptidase [Actinomycetota bacterium]
MCDTICRITAKGTFFAKASDRPVGEPQVIGIYPGRNIRSPADESMSPLVGHALNNEVILSPGDDVSSHATISTQYLTIEDANAYPCLFTRPTWLWGAEHGINAHKVAIGNEKVYTVDDPYQAAPALIGMDLVRLGLERSVSALQAVNEITALIERYGQGGVADKNANEPYWSSFLIADPNEAWVLETSSVTWAAKRIGIDGTGGAAISNRLTLCSDWDMASDNISTGSDFNRWRSPDAPTAHADVRLAASHSFLASPEAVFCADSEVITAAAFVAYLRDHGSGPWGNPMQEGENPAPPPALSLPDGTGVSICMHIRSYQATTAAMVAFLPSQNDQMPKAWVAMGSPCCSVFMPVLSTISIPDILTKESTWQRFDLLRQLVEDDPPSIERVRAVLAPLERSLWEEASQLGNSAQQWYSFHNEAGPRVLDRLKILGV